MEKRGFIKVSKVFLEKETNIISAILKDFRLTEIEHSEYHFIFIGESELFDSIKDSDIIPEYECIIHILPVKNVDENPLFKIEFKKVA